MNVLKPFGFKFDSRNDVIDNLMMFDIFENDTIVKIKELEFQEKKLLFINNDYFEMELMR